MLPICYPSGARYFRMEFGITKENYATTKEEIEKEEMREKVVKLYEDRNGDIELPKEDLCSIKMFLKSREIKKENENKFNKYFLKKLREKGVLRMVNYSDLWNDTRKKSVNAHILK